MTVVAGEIPGRRGGRSALPRFECVNGRVRLRVSSLSFAVG
jgi:hypothetical protein